MKALTLKDPWASFILNGKKTIETRKWKTNYRGDIIITCSKNPKSKYSGKAICIVELYDIQKMQKEHEKDAMCKIYDSAYSWFLRNLRVVDPFDVKGKLGLFDLNL